MFLAVVSSKELACSDSELRHGCWPKTVVNRGRLALLRVVVWGDFPFKEPVEKQRGSGKCLKPQSGRINKNWWTTKICLKWCKWTTWFKSGDVFFQETIKRSSKNQRHVWLHMQSTCVFRLVHWLTVRTLFSQSFKYHCNVVLSCVENPSSSPRQ